MLDNLTKFFNYVEVCKVSKSETMFADIIARMTSKTCDEHFTL